MVPSHPSLSVRLVVLFSACKHLYPKQTQELQGSGLGHRRIEGFSHFRGQISLLGSSLLQCCCWGLSHAQQLSMGTVQVEVRVMSVHVLPFPKSQLPASLHPRLSAPQQSRQLGPRRPRARRASAKPRITARNSTRCKRRISPASPSGECRTEPPWQHGCASRLIVPWLPPTAPPAARPPAPALPARFP